MVNGKYICKDKDENLLISIDMVLSEDAPEGYHGIHFEIAG